ncbi:SusC/RagA family TonB-linked outer membrane protein [Mucilaginibacter agri]|uniref:SusC/RagA family TonB-linked outer membrane protein n=1 Tax=Mucilaginibacter agri TaxID=2695265 RepID=A0A966DRQ6_9SPHI|nr:TonB-dependent receptor [Mucilaginibacter agri]NCD68740.1 SusC/RagA family TonB-linked outer membrane protein [Mucilaginibacter agri]
MYKKLLLKKLLLCHLLVLLCCAAMAQGTAVTGKVTDEKGLPLPGVTIAIKGTARGTNAGTNGSFSLTASPKDVLVFSMIGYSRIEETVGERKVINVQMNAEQQSLNEVVVVGYGTQRRKDLTGSVGSVKGEAFKDQPITNPTEALQGRIAGVNVVKNSGAPDATPSIIIRGVSSLNQPNPLYIVDGVRVPDGNNINVQDIATIDVLKDASSAAIYGAAAAGGVIVITTKKGSGSEPKVSISARYGITKPKLVQLLNKTDFIALENIVNPTAFQTSPGVPKAGLDTLANTDWVKALYSNAYEQNYNASVSGSTPSVNYLVSGFYNRQKGIYINNYSNIGGARVNTDYKLAKWLKFGEQLAVSQRKTAPPVGTEAQLHNAPFRTLPIIPVTDRFGNYGTVPQGYGSVSLFGGPNPIGSAENANALNYKNNFQSNVYADIILPYGFDLRTNVSYNYYQENQDFYQNAFVIGQTSSATNSLTKTFIQSTQFLTNEVLSWNHSYGKHNLSAIAGYEEIQNKYNNVVAAETSIGLPGYSFIQTSASNLSIQGKNDANGLIKSKFARLNYNFNSRYYLSGSVRQDANYTVFGPDKQKGTFASGSAGWNISEEEFFKPLLPVINSLKFRGSYGELGNSTIAPYLYNLTYAQFMATNGIASGAQNFSPGGPLIIATSANGIANPDLHWETVKESSFGIDGEAMHGSIYYTVEYYNKKTDGMLYNIALPLSSGFTAPFLANVGKVSNKGFDILLGYRHTGKDFSYDISVNGGFNKNNVISLSGLATDAIYDGYNFYSFGDTGFNMMPNQTLTITKAGLPFGSFYGYKALGLFQTDAEAAASPQKNAHAGDVRFQDLNNDGKITDADRQVIGNPNPKLVYGISAKMNYKGVDLALLFNGVAGVDLFNGVKAYEQFPFADGNTTSQVFKDSFLGSNGLTDQPRLGVKNADGSFTIDPNKNYQTVSSYFVESGNYLKLKNAQLGYTFSAALLQKIKIRSARVFVMGNNLFTITSYKGLDPELGAAASAAGYSGATTRGVDAVSQYPQTRIYSIGLDVNF